MAINTSNTFLMKGTTSNNTTTWAKLIDIKDFPDLGSAAPTLDTTTLSDKMHTYIADISDTGGNLEFTSNYTKSDYSTLAALAGAENDYAVWFGASENNGVVTPDGSDGKFSFKGELSVWKKGAGVGAVQEMGVAIAPSTEIKFA
jgi:hypothetical protein